MTGLLKAGMAEQADGQLVHLGTGSPTRVIDLARRINELTESRGGVAFRPRRDWDTDMRAGGAHRAGRDLLGHECCTPITTGLARTAAWFIGNWPTIRKAARW